MAFKDEAKNERKKYYFDIVCGLVFLTMALVGMYISNELYGITNNEGWFIGVTFCILCLIFYLALLFLGIYNKWKENHPDKKQPKKKLKAPLVS